jgi:hypothetical protein
MNTATITSKQLAKDFEEHLTGKLNEDVVRRTVESLETITESQLEAATPAHGSIVSLVFWMQGQCIVDSPGGKTFNGTAGGLATPGGGALFGDVYLVAAPTLEELYRKTDSWAFVATTAYTAFYFFDSKSTPPPLLGSFQSFAVSIVSGGGTGPGSWS